MTKVYRAFFKLFPLLLLIFIDSFSYFIVIPVLLKLFYPGHADLLPASTSINTRNILTGITISLSAFSSIIAAPFIGAASDRFGRKKALLSCIACVAIGFLLPIIGIIKKNILFILLGRIFAGAGSASQPIAQAVVADTSEKQNRALFLSLIALMMTLALIFAPLAGGYLTDFHLFDFAATQTPFIFSFLLSLLNLVLLIFFFTETKRSAPISMPSISAITTGLPSLIKHFRIGFLILIFFFLELAWSGYYQSVSLVLHLQLHYSAEEVGLFNSAMGITMAIGLLIFYPILLRFFSVNTILKFSLLFVFLSLMGSSLFHTPCFQWIFANILSLFVGITYVSVVAIISNKTSSDHQGLVMGYLTTLLFSAWMLTAFDAGWLVSYNTNLPIYMATVFSVIALFGIFSKKGNRLPPS